MAGQERPFDWATQCPEYGAPDPRTIIYRRATQLAQAVTR